MTNTPDLTHLMERIESLEHEMVQLREQLATLQPPEPWTGVAGIEPPTDDELRQARLNHYAATCPITLTEALRAAKLEPGENFLEAYVQLRWDYARKMDEVGTRP